MKKFNFHHSYLKSIIYLLFIGLLVANTGSYDHWILNSDSELIELISGEDKGASEEDSKKEKADTYLLDLSNSNLELLSSIIKCYHSEILLALHHPEITTPPPQSILF